MPQKRKFRSKIAKGKLGKTHLQLLFSSINATIISLKIKAIHYPIKNMEWLGGLDYKIHLFAAYRKHIYIHKISTDSEQKDGKQAYKIMLGINAGATYFY